MVKNVLVAVDGSETSNKALDFALDLAEKFDAGLEIINVSETAMGAVPQDPTGVSGVNPAMFSKDIARYHEEIVSKAVARIKSTKPTMVVSGKVREGNPALEIVAEAKEAGFDVIVVGHKGVGKVKELLGLGGISEKVAHIAPCPVVIVR